MKTSTEIYLYKIAEQLRTISFAHPEITENIADAAVFLYEYSGQSNDNRYTGKADELITEMENDLTVLLQQKNPLAIKIVTAFTWLVSRQYLESDEDQLNEYDQYLYKQYMNTDQQEALLKYYSQRVLSYPSVLPLSRILVDNLIRLERILKITAKNTISLRQPMSALYWLQRLSDSYAAPLFPGILWEEYINKLKQQIRQSEPSPSPAENYKANFLLTPQCPTTQDLQALITDNPATDAIPNGLCLLVFSQPTPQSLLPILY